MFAENTKVPVIQSRAEIERLLSKHKCSQFMCGTDYDHGIARVQFKAYNRYVRFIVHLPDRAKYKMNTRVGAARWEQAERQKWRALLLVIKAKLECVENNIATFEEEFLAHIVMPGDRTVADMILPQIETAYASGQVGRLLEAGTVVVNANE
jgi:hypothetical protein